MKHYKSFKEAVAVLRGNAEKAQVEKKERIKNEDKNLQKKDKVVEEDNKNEDKN